jgi:hypothetical protein
LWKSKEISQDLRKDLHKSGSSLGAIPKHLKVPHSSVQTIVRKYKHHGTTKSSYRSGRRRLLSPLTWTYFGAKSANQSQNNSKGPYENAGGYRYKSIYIHSKTSPIST